MVRVPRLSILVPFLQTSSSLDKPFEDTLASILQHRPADCEVLVSHAGGYLDPYGLGDEVRFLAQPVESSLVALVNGGVERARGEVLHVLTPGHSVSEGWIDEPLAAFEDPQVGSVVPVIVSETNPDYVVNCGVGYSCGGARWVAGGGQSARTIATKTPAICGPSLAAGFYRTDALCSLEGLAVDLGETLADIDVALSLRAIGYRSVVSAACVIRSCLPPAREAASYRHGQQAERLFRRHAGQLGWFRSWVAHPLTVLLGALADVPHPGAVTQFAGRIQAWLEQQSHQRYRELLEEAREEAAFVQRETLAMPRGMQRQPGQFGSGQRRAA